jgi:hypothetical protein
MPDRRWILAACLLAACASSTPTPSATHELGGSCTKEAARRLVDDFFASWNARDADRVAALFSPGFSFFDNVGGKRSNFSGHDALRRYVAGRFALDDHFSSLAADIPENPSASSANPTVSFVRTASGTTYRGNAKLVCSNNSLIGFVMTAE